MTRANWIVVVVIVVAAVVGYLFMTDRAETPTTKALPVTTAP